MMGKKIFKIFADAIDGQERWLNEMSVKGFRLVNVSRWHYMFEECAPSEYVYRIEFVADKSKKELDNYMEFLSNLEIKSLTKNINIGKYSYGNIRLRPYGKNATSFATSPGNINSELLILEKKNNGKPFEIFTDTNDKIAYYRKTRNAFALTASMLIIALIFSEPRISLLGKDYSQYITPIASIMRIILLILCVPLCIKIFKFTSRISELNKEKHIME